MKPRDVTIPALFCALLALAACETTPPRDPSLGDPIKTIENPFQEEAYKQITRESYVSNGELWRGDASATCQVEVYKLEGKNAVILEDRSLIDEKEKNVKQLTTRKRIYRFFLQRPNLTSPIWWINKVEVYRLPSEDPSRNPALLNTNAPEFREPSSLSPAKGLSGDPSLPSE